MIITVKLCNVCSLHVHQTPHIMEVQISNSDPLNNSLSVIKLVWLQETLFSHGNSDQLISEMSVNHFLKLHIPQIHLTKTNKIILPWLLWSLPHMWLREKDLKIFNVFSNSFLTEFSQSIQRKTNSVTYSRAGLRTRTFNASNIRFNSTNGSFWLGSTERPDSWKKIKRIFISKSQSKEIP